VQFVAIVEKMTYPTEWLDSVIQKCKYVRDELKNETFKRYREIGKIILDSGYQKGTWNDEHKQKFLIELSISRQTFSSLVQIGEMSEEEFANAVSNFSSYHEWRNRGSIAKKQKREREILILEKAVKFLPPPEKKYDVIVVDPPWNYGTNYNPDTRRVASPYPEMSIEEIKNMDLPNTENCVLWLWTTNTFMHQAFHIIDAWGFEPKTILTWAKNKFGVGHWLRGQTEHCILAIKGNPTYNVEEAKNISTLLHANSGGHSEKPSEFYEIVDKVCVGWKIDYHARQQRHGWDNYGTMELEKT